MPGSISTADAADRITIPGHAAFNGLSAFTVAMWLTWPTTGVGNGILVAGASKIWEMFQRPGAGTGIRFNVMRATELAVTSCAQGEFTGGQQYFIAGRVDSGDSQVIRLYKGTPTSDAAELTPELTGNGSGAITSLAGADITVLNYPASVGDLGVPCNAAHVCIFTSALSLAAIIDAQYTLAGRIAAEAYVRLAHVDDLADLAGHGHDATQSGLENGLPTFPELMQQQAVGPPLQFGSTTPWLLQ